MKAFVTRTISIPTNGILLHAEAAGPENGPLVLLLHGFPENWAAWSNQIGALARSGFHVVVPDQRGYNLSAKPQGIDSYAMDKLVADVLGILDFFGREKATLIGHDWGGAVAWQVAIRHPERVERLGILNIPHPAALAHALTKPAWSQLLRSWYIYFFQIPSLPEFLLSLGHYAPMRRMLRASSRPDTFSREILRRYMAAWARPDALTSMINWYRAAVQLTLRRGRDSYLKDAGERVTVPTLILWGERDVALIPQLAQWSLQWCDQGQLVRFPEASHWVQHEEAERVNNRLLDFLEELL